MSASPDIRRRCTPPTPWHRKCRRLDDWTFPVRACKCQTPLHGHRLRTCCKLTTPPADELTTILQLVVQQIIHHRRTKICHIPTSWRVAMLGSGIALWQICCTTSCRIVVSSSVGGIVQHVRSRCPCSLDLDGYGVVEFGTNSLPSATRVANSLLPAVSAGDKSVSVPTVVFRLNGSRCYVSGTTDSLTLQRSWLIHVKCPCNVIDVIVSLWSQRCYKLSNQNWRHAFSLSHSCNFPLRRIPLL